MNALASGMSQPFYEQVRAFYAAHRQGLFTYALLLSGRRDAAEDAVHAAFANLLRRGRIPREWRSYVFRCVRNEALQLCRQEKRRSERESILAQNNGQQPPGSLHGWHPEDLQAALETLGDAERESIVLKLYDGLTFREIAAVRGVSINTASSWYRRGIEKLRSILEKEA